jgi:hypothetical protein
MINVKDWVAVPLVLVAVIVEVNVPSLFEGQLVPASVAVPLWLSVKVTPQAALGAEGDQFKLIAGVTANPAVVTVNDPEPPWE